jgi:Ca2+-binding RTX toxin-like protein
VVGGNVIFTPDANFSGAASFSYDIGDTAGITDTASVAIAVAAVNDAPAAPVLSSATVAENAPAGTVVGVLSSSDADGDSASFVLTGNPGGLFRIVGNVLQTTAPLDFENRQSHTVTVEVRDGEGGKTAKSFTIGVTDLDDAVVGGKKGEKLVGTPGADDINGRGGSDRLFGDAGADTLAGGRGRDVLTGGSGEDVFRFLSAKDAGKGGKRDVVTDFEKGIDRIDLSGTDANGRKKGDGSFKFIRKDGAAFKDKAGELIWERIDKKGQKKDFTLIQGDINGDGKADFQIALKGLIKLDQADFLL